MANENFGAGFSIDISNLKAGLAAANKLIRESEAEFKAAAAGMDDWSKSQEGLEKRVDSLNKIVDVQSEKVKALQREKERIISTMQAEGKSHEEIARAVDDVNGRIIKESNALDKQKAALEKAQKALDNFNDEQNDAAAGADKAEREIKEMGDAAEDSGDGFTIAKGAVAGFVADGLSALVSKIGEAVGSLIGLADETREYRSEMAKLDTSFETAGLSAETAQGTFKDLYGIMADEGAATEAAQQLAKISDSQKELDANTRILTGVWAEYGNSIPVEGLAEGMAATAKMGEVQGVLADALEWQGINLDNFNEKLASMSSEEERAAYIQETLTDLYGESADKFRENNESVIAANEAQADYNDVMAELGETLEPITTIFKSFSTDLLGSVSPFIGLIGEGFTDALNGTAGASDKVSEGINGIIDTLLNSDMLERLPEFVENAIDVILSALPTLAEKISESLPTIIKKIGETLPRLVNQIVSIVKELTGMLTNPESMAAIHTAAMELLGDLAEGLGDAIPVLVSAVTQIVENLTMFLTDPMNYAKLIGAALKIIVALGGGLISAIPELLASAVRVIDNLIDTFKNTDFAAMGKYIIDMVKEGLSNAKNNIVEWFTNFGEEMKTMFSGIVSSIKNFFSNLWLDLKAGASDAWAGIENIFSVVTSWFDENIIQPVSNFFSDMWSGLTGGASDAWSGIKETFSKVADFFGNIFGDAWERVKNIFSTGGKIFDGIKEGIASTFTTVVNGIIRGINKVVSIPFNAINSALSKIKNAEIAGFKPFEDKISTITVPQIPELAEGGILTRATHVIAGEAGAEAVLPLERNTGWMDMLADKLASKMPAAGAVVNQTNNFSQAHSRYELYKTKQQTLAALRLAAKGG